MLTFHAIWALLCVVISFMGISAVVSFIPRGYPAALGLFSVEHLWPSSL